jgi:class 3 adenylate cyclase/pimeloyl-ACP methyl ester carboxylesterase
VERRLAAILAADAVGYSRMMREDEPGALALLQKHRAEVIDPAIAKHRGRTVKLMGDGLLAEFSSVVEGVSCAAEIQRAMAARNAGSQDARQMAFRIGVHLGDIIVEGDDIYGDGVNIAARLEGIAERGGVCISRQAYDHVQKQLALGYRSLGRQNLKNIPDPVEVFAIQGDGLAVSDDRQEIRYCRTTDGVRLAYAISGHGPPLVKTGNWLSHLEYDWDSPVWRPFLLGLSKNHRLVRYDPRGTGLSDWDVADISLDAWVNDLATVVDAAGVDQFPLFGLSQGCAVSIAYSVRHPERVSRLILCGGFALGGYKRSPRGERTAQGADDLDAVRMGCRQSGHPANVHVAIDARRQQGTSRYVQRIAAANDFGRMRLPLFRHGRSDRRRRTAVASACPDTRLACAGRCDGSV